MNYLIKLIKNKFVLSINLNLIFSLFVFATAEPFYSVQPILDSITQNDFYKDRILNVAPPETLFHWASIKSVKRLFTDYKNNSSLPLKILGSDIYMSTLVANAPAFKDTPGLYTWHNPIGATIGGSNEVYGNSEALIGLRIHPQARIGLIVTSHDGSPDPKLLADSNIRNRYDIILHANGDFHKGKFGAGYLEWVIVNPAAVTDFTLDPELTTLEMKKYWEVLKRIEALPDDPKDVRPRIVKIAGPQHAGYVSWKITSEYVVELATSILQRKSQLPKKLQNGWHSVQSPALRMSSLKSETRLQSCASKLR